MLQYKIEMLIKAALPLGISKKTWVWEKVCYPVGQVQGMQLELPKALPMEASGAGDTGSLLGHGCRSLAAPGTGEERRNVTWVGLPRTR